ncbi:NAD(P)/FAD-dependent oxidoreductase [Halolamina salifodinae]|uniref:Sarcosine oxidase subunit beta n=1 Tax=Halolamina salifodinae TaxID=1202767 RepID=A0A8T4GWX0_9EURY|nr:FAD-dependent oxidoreductase [Halolamina salifodinae]MBP1987426.1 sarcosine oxidase subunit beta [Halolamina salifodinae]
MRTVVVGGGIVGLSSAYALAERGADVTVCEKGRLGDGSTSRALGGIRAQFSTAVNVDLTLASLPVWESFEERFGVDIAFRQTGYLMLARTEETAAGLERQVEMQREQGAGTELLTPEEAAKHCVGVDPDAITAATFNARDGFADPYLALQGFADAAREAGVNIRTNTAVTDVQVDDGRAVGVAVEGDGAPRNGIIDADAVVNATGPWAARIAELAGVNVPVGPQRRQAVVVDPERSVPESDPLTIDLETGSHFRPERDGAAVVGGYFADKPETPSPDDYSDTHDLPWAAQAVERAGIYCDYFGDGTRIKRGWAGLYAVTPDHHPIIEESRPGFVQAIGFSGHGFQHAPATGQVVAELLLDGEASTVDIDALGSDRFEEGELLQERNVA